MTAVESSSRLAAEYATRGFVTLKGFFSRELIARAAAEALTLPERFAHLIDRRNMRCRFMENVRTGQTQFEVFDGVNFGFQYVGVEPVTLIDPTTVEINLSGVTEYAEPNTILDAGAANGIVASNCPVATSRNTGRGPHSSSRGPATSSPAGPASIAVVSTAVITFARTASGVRIGLSNSS